MVLVKVSDGHEIRKLEVSPEATYDQLREQVRKLFPSLAEGVEFSLQYRDDEGDIISLSTDEELRTALAHIPQDAVWRLQAVPRRRGAPLRERPVHQFPHYQSRHRHYTNPFLIVYELPDPSPSPQPTWGSLMKALNEELQQLQKMHDDHVRQFKEQKQKVEKQMQKTVDSQQSAPAAQGDSGEGQVAETGKPTWHVQHFGSWEPQTFESPYGQRTVVGPVGYHMYWGYSDPSQSEEPGQPEKSQKSEDKSTGKTEISDAAAELEKKEDVKDT